MKENNINNLSNTVNIANKKVTKRVRKSKSGKFLIKFAVLLVLLIIIFCFISYIVSSNSNAKLEDLAYQNKIQQEVDKLTLQENFTKVQNVISEINKNVEFTVLKQKGKYTISSDKTPENNSILEWLINSEITLNIDYTAIFSIDTDNIVTAYDENTIYVKFSHEQFYINSVDMEDIIPIEIRSLLGKKYSSNEVLALEKIAKENIVSTSLNYENKMLAAKNLKEYISTSLDKLGIKDYVILDVADVVME